MFLGDLNSLIYEQSLVKLLLFIIKLSVFWWVRDVIQRYILHFVYVVPWMPPLWVKRRALTKVHNLIDSSFLWKVESISEQNSLWTLPEVLPLSVSAVA